MKDQYVKLEKDGGMNVAQLIKEMRLRKKKTLKSELADEAKKLLSDGNLKNRSKKMVTLVAKGNCVIGAVFHVNDLDNKGEFDPFFIERMKNCLHLMTEKEFVMQIE